MISSSFLKMGYLVKSFFNGPNISFNGPNISFNGPNISFNGPNIFFNFFNPGDVRKDR